MEIFITAHNAAQQRQGASVLTELWRTRSRFLLGDIIILVVFIFLFFYFFLPRRLKSDSGHFMQSSEPWPGLCISVYLLIRGFQPARTARLAAVPADDYEAPLVFSYCLWDVFFSTFSPFFTISTTAEVRKIDFGNAFFEITVLQKLE